MRNGRNRDLSWLRERPQDLWHVAAERRCLGRRSRLRNWLRLRLRLHRVRRFSGRGDRRRRSRGLLDDEVAAARMRRSSYRLSHRLRCWIRRRRRRRWRLRRGQEPDRIEVAERVGRLADAEVDVWDWLLWG